ncbi:hypothetical protein HOB87_08940 [Candidatus Woesearchaeota archaeon]|jgi:hypothetical protein|nr:hypothetical protein [Candidatus Woesearchaeota archaeon]
MEAHYIALLFFLFWVAILIYIKSYIDKKANEALGIFPSIDSVNILFREKGVSGKSRKSFSTKMSGVINILDIIVTNDELWIRGPKYFVESLIESDLLHKVNIKDIVNVEFNKKNKVVLSFKSNSNSLTVLDLKMKKAKVFVETFNLKN